MRLRVPFCVAGAALWRWLESFVAGAAFPASRCTFAWRGQHFGSCLKGLDVGAGCCRARGSGPRFAWQAQHS